LADEAKNARKPLAVAMKRLAKTHEQCMASNSPKQLTLFTVKDMRFASWS
jgi:hypothetical protein